MIEELRGWHPGVPEATLEELVVKFGLPELVVRRIADSEGFALGVPTEVGDDPNTTTQPIEFRRDED